MKLLHYKWYKSFFEIGILLFCSLGVFLVTNFLTTTIFFMIMLFFSWLYIRQYSNDLYFEDKCIILKNTLKVFKKPIIINLNDIDFIEINRKVRERRKWNIIIREKSGKDSIFYFQITVVR